MHLQNTSFWFHYHTIPSIIHNPAKHLEPHEVFSNMASQYMTCTHAPSSEFTGAAPPTHGDTPPLRAGKTPQYTSPLPRAHRDPIARTKPTDPQDPATITPPLTSKLLRKTHQRRRARFHENALNPSEAGPPASASIQPTAQSPRAVQTRS